MIDTKGFSAVEKFEEISSRTRKRLKQLGLEPDEVKEAVRWVRESLKVRNRPEGANFD